MKCSASRRRRHEPLRRRDQEAREEAKEQVEEKFPKPPKSHRISRFSPKFRPKCLLLPFFFELGMPQPGGDTSPVDLSEDETDASSWHQLICTTKLNSCPCPESFDFVFSNFEIWSEISNYVLRFLWLILFRRFYNFHSIFPPITWCWKQNLLFSSDVVIGSVLIVNVVRTIANEFHERIWSC